MHLLRISCSTLYVNGLVQERRNSNALALELRVSCYNPSMCYPENNFVNIGHDWHTHEATIQSAVHTEAQFRYGW